jgi:electron transport complex protein RnfG
LTSREIIKITFNLVALYLVGGFLLAAVYSKTSPIIFMNNKIAKEKALKEMVPEADEAPEKLGDWSPHEKHAEYFVAKKNGEVIGYVVQTFGKGYSSYIDILFSVDTDFNVKKMNVLNHAETPGLGDEIELDYFKKRFEGKDKDHLKVLKTETTEYIQAISGATISTRAVSEDGIQNGLKFLIEALKGEGTHEPSAHGEG